MRFAHLADVHIGAWRDPALKNMNLEAFRRAIHMILEKNVDFVLIAGDLFNTPMPSLEHLKQTVGLLKRLRKQNIPVYVVPGSHDYSPGGRTIIDVLEEAELLVNVMQGEVIGNKLRLMFTVDKKTGAKITGVRGKRGSLEKKDFELLDVKPLEEEQGFKIFMFHTSLDELKPEEMEKMESMPASEMPRGFDYYAGGHVHIVEHKDIEDYHNLVYPGPVFPANFAELWKLGRGGFYVYDDTNQTGKNKLEFIPLNIKNTYKIEVSADNKTPEVINHELEAKIQQKEFNHTIVLLKVGGKLKSGKPSDIDFKNFFRELYNKSTYFVMRNTSQLSSKEMEEVNVSSGSAEQLEEELIKKHLGRAPVFLSEKEECTIKKLIQLMSEEQKEGEKKYEYEARMKKEADEALGF
ncbi:DNA repair exonuclease [Candidatus Woesearchaeota archaeon]|nr:DNA repair exonuclease [Candidatus Woesearchaeota archaeon]